MPWELEKIDTDWWRYEIEKSPMKMKKSSYLLAHVTSLQVQYCAPLRTQFKLIVHHRTHFLRQAVDLYNSCTLQCSWIIINLCCEYKNTRIEIKCSSIKDLFRWEQVEILAVIWAVLSTLSCFAKLHHLGFELHWKTEPVFRERRGVSMERRRV